jgi:peptidoglycan/LPS O-acetylase OafA/YrhL
MSIKPDNSASDNRDIRTLQYGRGVAALLVCIFHFEGGRDHGDATATAGADQMLSHLFRAGHSGVEFFFLLSGFIIFYAHRNDLNRPQQLSSFYLKRAIRILPMYWLIMVPFGIALLTIAPSEPITAWNFLLDVFLIPHDGKLVLSTAWTLQHELVFYVLFGILIVNRAWGIVALLAWQAACMIVLAFGLLPQDYSIPETTFFGYYNFGFIIGMGIAFLYQQDGFGRHCRTYLALGWAGFAGILVCFAGEARFGSAAFFPSPAASTLIYFGLYALIILALLSAENRPHRLFDATFGVLGGASYILYLIHVPLASIFAKLMLLPLLRPFAGSTSAIAATVAATVAVSIVLYYLIERPALRRLRRFLLPRPRTTKAGKMVPAQSGR